MVDGHVAMTTSMTAVVPHGAQDLARAARCHERSRRQVWIRHLGHQTLCAR